MMSENTLPPDRRKSDRRKGDRRKGGKQPQYCGDKIFEGFIARVFINAAKLARNRICKWKEDRGDGKSRRVSKRVPDAVLLKEITGARKRLPFRVTNAYARMADMKYWGLLEQKPEWWHFGIYQMTPKGWEFLAGRVRVARTVKVQQGKLVSESSDDTMSLQEALGDSWNTVCDWIADWRRGKGQAHDNGTESNSEGLDNTTA